MSTRRRDILFTATASIAVPYSSGAPPAPEVVWPQQRQRTGRDDCALPLLLTAAEFHGNPIYRGCTEPLRTWLADHCLNADDCLQLLFRDGSLVATVLERNADGKPVLLPDRSDVATTTLTVSMHSLPPLPQFGHGLALPPLPADRGDDWRAAVETLLTAKGRLEGEWDR